MASESEREHPGRRDDDNREECDPVESKAVERIEKSVNENRSSRSRSRSSSRGRKSKKSKHKKKKKSKKKKKRRHDSSEDEKSDSNSVSRKKSKSRTDTSDWYSQILANEKSKPKVGTVHASDEGKSYIRNNTTGEVQQAGDPEEEKLKKKLWWKCAKCGKDNYYKKQACEYCDAMKRFGSMM